jgi:hypothetical protein
VPDADDQSRDARLFFAGTGAGLLGNILVTVIVTDFSTRSNGTEQLVSLLLLTFLTISLIAVALTTTDLLAAFFDWIAVAFVGLSLMYSLLALIQLGFTCTFCPQVDVTFRGTLVMLGVALTVWVTRLITVPFLREWTAGFRSLRTRWVSRKS